jgi:hypothetical protein
MLARVQSTGYSLIINQSTLLISVAYRLRGNVSSQANPGQLAKKILKPRTEEKKRGEAEY